MSSEKKETLIDEVNVYRELDDVNKQIGEARNKLGQIVKILEQRKKELQSLIMQYAEENNWSRFNPDFLINFVEEPYVIEPSRIGKDGKVIEWHVYVPKMVKFQVGRLERATHSYNVFSVTQYMHHFAEIPDELSDRFPKLDVELKVVNGLLVTDDKDTDNVFNKYRQYLYKKEGAGKLRIKKGSEWEII